MPYKEKRQPLGQNPNTGCRTPNSGKPAGTGEALRTTWKRRQPKLRHQRSSRAGRSRKWAENPKGEPVVGWAAQNRRRRRKSKAQNTTDRSPPQEQDRQKEAERMREPRRGTCGRVRRGKPQAPQEEAQKKIPRKRLHKCLPSAEQEEKGRHSATVMQCTHTEKHQTTQVHHTMKAPQGARLAAKRWKASHRRQRPKRMTGRRS